LGVALCLVEILESVFEVLVCL